MNTKRLTIAKVVEQVALRGTWTSSSDILRKFGLPVTRARRFTVYKLLREATRQGLLVDKWSDGNLEPLADSGYVFTMAPGKNEVVRLTDGTRIPATVNAILDSWRKS